MTLPIHEYDFDSGEQQPYVFMADDDADSHVRWYREFEEFRSCEIYRLNEPLGSNMPITAYLHIVRLNDLVGANTPTFLRLPQV
jgi:hypothetical protein